MSTVVLYSKEDAIKYLSSTPLADKILPLTPNASAMLIDKVDIPILDPINYFSDFSHKRIQVRVRNIEKELYQALYDEKYISLASKETFRAIFHGLSSKIFYLWYSIKNVGPWIVRDQNGWRRESELSRAHKLLCNEIHISGKGLFNGSFYQKVKKQRAISPRMTMIINILTKKLLTDSKCFFFTGQTEAFSYLQRKISDSDKNTIFVELKSATDIKTIFMSIIKIASFLTQGSKNLNLLVIPQQNKDINYTILNLLNKIKDSVINNVETILKDSLIPAVSYTESLSKGSEGMLNSIKNVTLVAHQSRLLEGAVISELVKKNRFRSILISHGSHPFFTKNSARYEHRENAQGLLVSPLATVSITQSPFAEKSAKLFMPELSRKNFTPIMWGYTKHLSQIREKNQIRTILHAGTTNKLNGRPWIYETSNEFVKGLKTLILSVDELKNTHLIIRVRPNLEWSVQSLKALLPKSPNYTIKTKGNFKEDLKKADLLISFSSTTIEESLYARKPVALFGGSERYRHLPGSKDLPNKKNRHAVYHLTEKKLSLMIDTILNSHKYSLLTDKELEGYVWSEKVADYDEFISFLLD